MHPKGRNIVLWRLNRVLYVRGFDNTVADPHQEDPNAYREVRQVKIWAHGFHWRVCQRNETCVQIQSSGLQRRTLAAQNKRKQSRLNMHSSFKTR